MRIAHVSDFYLPRLGGIEMHIHDLATRQLAAGHDVEIITTSPEGSSRAAVPEAYRASPLTVRRLVRGPLGVCHPCAPARVRRAIAEGKYDVIHVHAGVLSPASFFAIHAGASRRIPTVVTMHSVLAWAAPLFRFFDFPLHWTRWPVQWTAVSDLAAEPLRRLVPEQGDLAGVRVLPNGVDIDSWQVQAEPRQDDDVLVAAVMRLAGRKRPLPLLRMLRQAREQVPAGVRMRAVIAGDGPSRRAMLRYLSRHQMTDWVQLAGRLDRDEVRHLLARADVFMAPASLESFGIAALEARCAGVPVIAPVVSGVARFIEDGVNGALGADDDAMATALAQLAADPARRAAIRMHNQNELPPFSWEETLARTWLAYDAAAQLAAGFGPDRWSLNGPPPPPSAARGAVHQGRGARLTRRGTR